MYRMRVNLPVDICQWDNVLYVLLFFLIQIEGLVHAPVVVALFGNVFASAFAHIFDLLLHTDVTSSREWVNLLIHFPSSFHWKASVQKYCIYWTKIAYSTKISAWMLMETATFNAGSAKRLFPVCVDIRWKFLHSLGGNANFHHDACNLGSLLAEPSIISAVIGASSSGTFGNGWSTDMAWTRGSKGDEKSKPIRCLLTSHNKVTFR